MTKNYWVQAAKFQQAKIQVVAQSEHQDTKADGNVEILSRSFNGQNSFCEGDRVLLEFLNDFKRLRSELKCLSTVEHPPEEHLNIIG
ncbi:MULTISPECIES: hypothetical protein [Vibrio]|uniref:hypothetical protein n=1 Tax=Vibrio TaxID=662 RepID=UPI0004201689|nr:hypothetical protein [Vibrio parahaemolyticus]EHK4786441.1 hypothetical protein [Vibrio parahaemolyticus]EIJ0976070.1 hypothetical protein [Vibrio parahaemolyticus]EKA6057120.1 hypothetical protein [Vibrio parahaemolyticus]EKK9975551.1 hypothetical protein [Vibrio parahaemolyticus]KON51898.1 hypothetical protein ACX02_20905 [Vibrio parahaemolyticus]